MYGAAERGELAHWEGTPFTLAMLIVVLDQFGRHLKRGQPREALAGTDCQALRCCQVLLDAGWAPRLSVPELVFALMPLRHSASLERLQRLQGLLAERKAADAEHAELLERFRQQSLRSLQTLQGLQWAPGQELLEHAEATTDEAELLRQPLARAVAAFLQRAPAAPALAVSLSGGVDSMASALARPLPLALSRPSDHTCSLAWSQQASSRPGTARQ